MVCNKVVLHALMFVSAASKTLVKTFAKYPGYTGNLIVSGSMEIESLAGNDTTATQTLKWTLAGLDTACTAGAGNSIANACGVHIHTGTSCDTHAGVGGHYYSSALSSDPWAPVVYIATSAGASEEPGAQVVTGLSETDIKGRVMIVHELASGARIACGMIVEDPAALIANLHVAQFSKYPGYSGSLNVEGVMTIESTPGTDTTAKQTMKWTLSGLDTACTAGAGDSISNGCGIHIHTGTSCATHAGVGGHYYSSALSSDPWAPIVYVTSSDRTIGSSDESGVQVVTGLTAADIKGRVMVVHELASGGRIACGVIVDEPVKMQVNMFTKYPGYTGNMIVSGSMGIESVGGSVTTAKQTMTWDLSGVDPLCTAGAGDSISNGCGIHIHTGTSCATHAGVGGHFYSNTLLSDPWASIVYVATPNGKSLRQVDVQVTTGLSAFDIKGRVMIVHELASGGRIACGVIEEGSAFNDNLVSGAPTPAVVGIIVSLIAILAH